MRKIFMRMYRKALEAPGVQERIKAVQAATPEDATQEERFYAHIECMMAVGNELTKKKWVKARPLQPAVHLMRIEGLVQRVENGHAIPGEIEAFRRWAGEVLGNWKPEYPPEFKERIEDALSHLKRP
jgi:hypothetical protein